MDFIREIDEMLMSSSSEDELLEELAQQQMVIQRPPRRMYRMYTRACVDNYDDVDFRKYFRLKKEAFWRLHSMVRQHSDGDRRRTRELTAEHKHAEIWSRLQPIT